MTLEIIVELFATAARLLASALSQESPAAEVIRDKIVDAITAVHLALVSEDIDEQLELDGRRAD